MPRMTGELLCKCSGQVRRKRDEAQEQFLRRITHLYCAEKGLENIDGLGSCRSLMVLYLYDNFISRLENLGALTSLTHLYLQNNHIPKIQGLGQLHKLTKLYLNGNAITVVEGLEGMTAMKELHVAHQRLPEGEKLLFDPRSLLAIAPSLTVLNVSGDALDTVEDLLCLTQLTHFSAADNELSDLKDVSKVFGSWPDLRQVELTSNPLCRKHKYRDRIITMCRRIAVLDGKEVSDNEREFLINWKAIRQARRKLQKLALKKAYSNNNAAAPLGGTTAYPGKKVKEPPTSLPPFLHRRRQQPVLSVPLTMPALPARDLPPRLQDAARFRRLKLNASNSSNNGGCCDSRDDFIKSKAQVVIAHTHTAANDEEEEDQLQSRVVLPDLVEHVQALTHNNTQVVPMRDMRMPASAGLILGTSNSGVHHHHVSMTAGSP